MKKILLILFLTLFTQNIYASNLNQSEQRNVERIENNIKKIEENINKIKEKNENHNQENSSANRNIKRLESRIENEREKIKKIEERASNRGNRTTKSNLKNDNNTNPEVERIEKRYNDRISQLRLEIQKYYAEIERLEIVIKNQSIEIQGNPRSIITARNNAEKTQLDIDNYKVAIESLNEDIKKLEEDKKNEVIKRTGTREEKRILTIRLSIERIQNQIDNIKSGRDNNELSLTDKNRIEGLKRRIQNEEKKIERLK